MKKLIFLISIVFITLSCEGPEGPQGPPGYGTDWDIIEIPVRQSDWELIGGKPGDFNTFYRCVINDRRFHQDIYDIGAIQVFQYQSVDGREVQTALPFVFHREQMVDGEYQNWTETLFYDFRPGVVTLYMYYSDFRTDLSAPPASDFRFVLQW